MEETQQQKGLKIALITGGASGIGLGISKELARNGVHLAICGRKPAGEVVNSLSALKVFNVDVKYWQCDITNSADRIRMVQEILSHFGALHILVNNAGVAPRKRMDILENTEDEFEWLMKINLQSPYFLTQEIANIMIRQKREDDSFTGNIINITSVSSEIVSTSRGEYCISKAGLSMMSKLFAVRLGEFDIPVVEIRPGIIKTDMTSGVTSKYDQLINEGLSPQRRWGLPADIGKAVASIVNGNFAFSTGSIIHIDGGLSTKIL